MTICRGESGIDSRGETFGARLGGGSGVDGDDDFDEGGRLSDRFDDGGRDLLLCVLLVLYYEDVCNSNRSTLSTFTFRVAKLEEPEIHVSKIP